MRSRGRAFPFLLFFIVFAHAAMADAPTPEERARALVQSINADDLDAYEEFYAEHWATDLDDEGRQAYARIVELVGQLRVEGVRVTGARLVLVCASSRIGDPVSIEVEFEGVEPGRITTLRLAVGGGDDEGPPPLPSPGVDPASSDDEIAATLGGWLEELAAADVFSGTVALTRGENTVFEAAFGLADRSFEVKNTTQTLFRVGSITKSFVQVVVARLVQEGRLDPYDTLAELLPDYPRLDIAGSITVDQLLAQRSGLGGMNYRAYLDSHAPEIRRPMDYINLFADEPLLFAPGTAREYSNAGYIVLGAVIEAVTGMPFEEAIDLHVFTPAGMEASCFVDLDRPQVAVATGYWHCDPAEPDLWCVNTPRLELVATAGGGNYSTAFDLIRFARALREGRLLSPGYTRWYYSGEWPEGEEPDSAAELPPDAIAGGAEGVSAVLFAADPWILSVTGNLGGDSAERVGIAIARDLRLMEGLER